jgi:hypothetical protein
LRQQAGVAKRLYMVKLYSHGGRLAVLSSRSNRGFGNQGSAYGLRSAASGPRASAGAGCANEANSRREYPTIPLIYHSTIPVPPVPSGAGPRGHGTRGLCETYPVLRFLIGDCGLGTDLGRDATPAACRLWPAQAGRTNKPNSQSRLCETKPNLGRMERLGGGASAEPIVRNKPNWARLGQGQGRDGRKMRNEYKSRHTGYPAIPLFHHSSTPIPLGVGRDETPGTWDAGQSCETRRARQKSPSWVSTRVSGPISQVGSVEPDFCRARQTKPICRSWCE